MTKRLSHPSGGFSLPELMVAVAIGLVLTLTISVMVSRQESVRRGVTSGNDLTGNAAYVSYLLDQELRSAGSGFSQGVAANYGCVLRVSSNAAQLLPSPGAFPAPFAAVPQNVVLAPLIVFAGAGVGGSDIIAMAAGHSGLAEAAMQVVPGSAAAGQVTLSHTLGVRGGDLVLVTQPTPAPPMPCMLQQVSAGFAGGAAQVLTFNGRFAADVIAGTALADFAVGNATVSFLGNVAGNQPRLQLLGIGDNDTLRAYDLLQLTPGVQTLADGVVDMRVRYGVANVPLDPVPANRNVANWVSPATMGFRAEDLASPLPAAQQALQSIVAVRVALVLRSDQVENAPITADTLTLFTSLPPDLRHTFNVPPGTTAQRYRTVEFTVPLRNPRLSR